MRRAKSGITGLFYGIRPELIAAVAALLVAAIVGYVLAGQIIAPKPRVIKAIMGLSVLVAAFILPNRYAIAFLLFVIPFPQNTTIGSTTVIFAYIIFSFWLVKMALGYERRPVLSGLEWPLIIIVLLYILSFVKVLPEHERYAIASFRTLISSLLIFYLVLNLIRTKKDIQFVLNALIASFAVVAFVAMIELWAPGYAKHLGFLHIKGGTGMEGVRLGSVFGDYEMFAEYLAIFIPILLVRIVSEKIFLRQIIWFPLMAGAIMLLIGTATRGAFLSLIVGMIYLTWISRRILNFQKFLPVIIIAAVAFYISSILLSQFTDSASLFARLGKTKIVGGMPDTRARVWAESWELVKESPWIGHGPWYPTGVDERNVRQSFPHNLFLFTAYCIGVPGAVIFLVPFIMALRRSYLAAKRFAVERSEFAFTVVILSSTLVIFLVDEIKICFLRYDQTQHFTWTMLALLTASSRIAIQIADERDRARSVARMKAIEEGNGASDHE